MIQALLFLFGVRESRACKEFREIREFREFREIREFSDRYELLTYHLLIRCMPKRAKRHPCHLALTFDKFCCTRHSQGESQEGVYHSLQVSFGILRSFA